MEQIETQASDLRYLSQSAALSAGPNPYDTPQPPQTQGRSGSADYGGGNSAFAAGEASANNPGNAGKRKSVDDGGSTKQTRSKRNRYISIACNECKRRKIKCNGETPCQRCGNLNLECLYAPNCCSSSFKDSDEFKRVTAQLARLQDEVDRLSQAVRAVQAVQQGESSLAGAPSSSLVPYPPSPPRQSSRSTGPAARSDANAKGVLDGPTSTAYSLDLANATITTMGWRASVDADEPESLPVSSSVAATPAANGADPLLGFDEDEMIRLFILHDEELVFMYPIIDTQRVIAHAKSITPFLDNARRQRSTEPINDDRTLLLKIVLCCSLVIEAHGGCERAARLHQSMAAVLNRKLVEDTCDVANLPILFILAGYTFLAGDEGVSWRVMGCVLRMCIELGINQRRGLERIRSEEERKRVLILFWSAYVLDRRWSFDIGTSFAIHDEEIDPRLPVPEDSPYLKAMVPFARLSGKVWRQVSHFGPVLVRELCSENTELLDQEILSWWAGLSDEFKPGNEGREGNPMPPASPSVQRMRIWTYLRFNQIRIWLYTPVLHSATSIMSNLNQARRVVDIAKDTIRYLSHLDKTTNLYRGTFYHQFLAAALSVVFLACVHAPVTFAGPCRDEFYMGLGLVKDPSTKNWISRRVWRAIKALEEIAPQFGLSPDEDPHSTAALGMVGLARGHMEPPPVHATSYRDVPAAPQAKGPLIDGGTRDAGRSTDFSRVFENYMGLYGGYDEFVPSSEDVSPDAQYQPGDVTIFPYVREPVF